MFRKNESGQAIVILAIGIVALLIMAALAIDAGSAYTAKREAQNAADAAALAGTRQLLLECSGESAPSEARIVSNVTQMAGANAKVGATGSPVQAYYLAEDGSLLNSSPLPLGDVPCGCAATYARGIQVEVSVSRSSFFAGLIGQSNLEAKATAKARYAPIASPDGNVYPVTRCDPTYLGDQGCQPMTVGQVVPLRLVDYDDGQPGHHYGNFGWLTWSGANSAVAARQSMTPPGTYHNPAFPDLDYYNPGEPSGQGNSVKWNSPILSDKTLAIGKWVQGAPGNMATINKQLEDYWVNIDRTMIIPLYSDAVGKGQNSGFYVSNFAAFKITCANLGGNGNRLGTCQYLNDFPQSEKWLEGYFLGYTAPGSWAEGCVEGGVNSVKLTP